MRVISKRRRLVGLALALGSAQASCDGCRDKPYTPFGVASTPLSNPLASASVAPEPSGSAAPPPKFAVRPAEAAPLGATRFTLGSRELSAPPGRAFALGLSADFDADGATDAVAWTVPVSPLGAAGAESGGSGELWYFPASAPARSVVKQPGFLPAAPGCRLTPTLAQTGDRSVTLDLSATCDAPQLARAPIRAVAVVAPTAEHPVIVMLRVAQAAPGESLKLSVDSTDRDGDGRDDVRLSATVQADGSARPATADVVWLDRAAGSSRDAGEPGRSLARAANAEAVRAKGKTTHKNVPDAVANLRRLSATLCGEDATPRIFDAEGAPLGCGTLQAFVDDVASSELTAALTRKDYVEAAAALSHDGWYHGKVSKDRRGRLERALESAVRRVEIAKVVELAARPPAKTSAPRWSPLRFLPDGRLIVQTPQTLVAVAADGSEQPLDDPAQVARWSLDVVGPSGERFLGTRHACDRSEVLLELAALGSSQPITLPTRLIAARPGVCRGAQAPALPIVTPLSFHASGLEALVGGSIVGPASASAEAALRPEQPGSARSPDGRELVVVTPLGLLVASRDSAELWKNATLTNPLALEGCTVSNGRTRVACLREGRALLFEPGQRADH
jgi:hypothetical protein